MCLYLSNTMIVLVEPVAGGKGTGRSGAIADAADDEEDVGMGSREMR